ncbi:phage major capsid protein, partial [bacterium]|nr:phage major capsid protein [bacterium]
MQAAGAPRIRRHRFHTSHRQPRPLDDAGFNIEAWLTNKVVDVIGRKENTAFVSGTG